MKLLVFSLFCSLLTFGQMPETDIWLFKIEKKEGKYLYTNPLNITHRAGYDNQPTFSLDGKSILYVLIDSTKQADIYQYSISKKITINLTKSQVSEYSPTIIPRWFRF
jgi:Tol biopolymer transport system component